MGRMALVVVLLAQAAAASAQDLSADDIRALVDQRVAGLDPFRALLSDPDETRAVAAMEIMMNEEDPELRRMALDHGLYSPAPRVRRTALDAFFATGPTLGLRMALPEGTPGGSRYWADISEYSGSIGEEGIGFFLLTVGAMDGERQCFLDAAGGDCLVRNTDVGVSILLWGNWWQLDVDDEGRLVGSGNSSRGTVMSATIPVTF